MRLIAPEVPDDPAALPGWLERHLTGLDLAPLVAELEAVHGPATADAAPLDRVLGDSRAEVLSRGLSVLPPRRLRQLLRRPHLLLDLQELVLVEGGTYWRQLGPPESEHREAIARGRARLVRFLSAEATARTGRPAVPSPEGPAAWYRRPWVVSLATAASVLALVVAYERSRKPDQVAGVSVGWGWNKPGALPQDLPPAAYLDRLAEDAREWFSTRPDDPVALARRIVEFRQGCSVVILAEHRPLSPEDKSWLVEKCRAWAAKLDAHLAAVEGGEDPAKVRAEADATVNSLIAALHERARAEA